MPHETAPDPIIRKTVSLPASVWKRIEDYQFAHQVKRDAEAVRRLVDLGLANARPADTREKPPYSQPSGVPPAAYAKLFAAMAGLTENQANVLAGLVNAFSKTGRLPTVAILTPSDHVRDRPRPVPVAAAEAATPKKRRLNVRKPKVTEA